MPIVETLIDRVFAARGIERLRLDPRGYQDKMVEWVAGAKKIRIAASAEQMYVWELPRMFTPDSWGKVIAMMGAGIRLRDGKGIQILRPPQRIPS